MRLPLWDRLVLYLWHAPRAFVLLIVCPDKVLRENEELRRRLAVLEKALDERLRAESKTTQDRAEED